MWKRILWLLAIVALSSGRLQAQDVVGDWQGTLEAGKGYRIVIKIAKNDSGILKAELYSIDVAPDGWPVNFISVQDGILKFSFTALGATYEGHVSGDVSAITGLWSQGGTSNPLNFKRATKETAWPIDAASHTVTFVPVADNVKLEVLDWGGSGRPVVLLSGLGGTAHIFDKFAPKLALSYHVYGITRRGYGASSAPAPINGNYSADRLGDDVVAVIDALKLNRPVLVGHSIAGEELSSIGSRHPEKVAGLVYLDAAYSYAFYDGAQGDLDLDTIELKKKLEELLVPGAASDAKLALIQSLQRTTLPQFEKDLQAQEKELQTMHFPSHKDNVSLIDVAILAGVQKYTDIRVPILAIFALPHDFGTSYQHDDPATRAALEASDLAHTTAQANAVEMGVPSARVVRLPHASHFLFVSNEADVLREINAFISRLP
jgi:pimeloyl-ACP methyl ester carboxylesterase